MTDLSKTAQGEAQAKIVNEIGRDERNSDASSKETGPSGSAQSTNLEFDFKNPSGRTSPERIDKIKQRLILESKILRNRASQLSLAVLRINQSKRAGQSPKL